MGYDTDRYIIANMLKEMGYNIYGRKDIMVVSPSSVKQDPLKEDIITTVRSLKNEGNPVNVKTLAKKIAADFGGEVDPQKIETKIRNVTATSISSLS